jgi:mono/diheme cytochrome c family protein
MTCKKARVRMHHLLRIGLLVGTAVLGTAPARAQSEIDAGRDVYAEHCATCHGERLSATGAAPDLKLLRADQKVQFDERIRNGKGQMPAWEGMISDEEINQIWDYIRSRAGK